MFAEKKQNILSFILAWIIAVAATLTGIAPRIIPVFLGLFFIIVLVMAQAGNRTVRPSPTVMPHSPPALLFLALVLYLSANSFWALDFRAAAGKTVFLTILVLSCLLANHLFKNLPGLRLWQTVRGIVTGISIGLVFLAVEFLTDYTLTRIAFNDLSLFSPGRKGLILDNNGMVKGVHSAYFGNQVALLNITFWSGLLIALCWPKEKLRYPLAALLFVMIVIVTFMSASESAKVALVLGSIAWAGTFYYPVLMHRAITAVWSMAVILVIPAVFIAYELGLQNSGLVSYTARHRVHIWHYTVSRIPEHPLLGIGIRSNHKLTADFEKQDKTGKIKNPFNRPTMHPHNGFLQTWHELGAIGATFLLITGLLLLQTIKRMDMAVRPCAYATFVSISSIAAFGYGLWQSWLMAGYGWAVIFFLAGSAYIKSRASTASDTGKIET